MKRIIGGEKPKTGYGKARERVAECLEYAVLLIVILECNSMYVHSAETVSLVGMGELFGFMMPPLLAALLALRAWPLRRRLRELAPNALVLGGLLCALGAFYVLNVREQEKWNQKDFFLNFLVCLPAMYALFKLKQREGRGLDILYKYSDIACVLGALGLLVFLASLARPDAVPSDVIYTRWNDRGRVAEQINLLEVCQFIPGSSWQMFGIRLLKNRGLFTEPLMFALPLLVALYTELFLREPSHRWRVFRLALLSVALVMVNATIALLLLAMAWGLKGVMFCLRGGGKRRKWLVAAVALAAVGACAVFIMEKSRASYEATNQSSNSIAMHIEDYIVCLRAFLDRPLLGGGYQNGLYIYTYMSPWRQANNPGLSNTAAVVLAEGGVLLGAICALPLVLGLFYLLRKRAPGMACWTLGILGVYAGIIFKYHLLLLMLMAFGYSLLDVQRVRGGGFPLRLTLADLPAREGEKEPVPGKAEGKARAFAAAGILALSAVLIWFGAPLWRAIHAFLRGRQLSLGQSPIRAFCLAMALLLHGVCARHALNREISWWRCAAILVWDAVYLWIYPALFSGVSTAMTLLGVWGELRESVVLTLAYVVPFALICLLRPGRWSGRARVALPAALAAAVCLALFGANWQLRAAWARADALAPALEELVDMSSAPVYVNDLPMLYWRRVKGLSLPATRDSGFEAYGGCSVVFPRGRDCREMFEAGFSVAELTPDTVLYTNDPAVLAGMEERGLAFYRYDPFDRAVDLNALAEKNQRSLTEDGALVADGMVRSLVSPSTGTLLAGEYTLECALRVDPEVHEGLAEGDKALSIALSGDYGERLLLELEVLAEAFDGENRATVRGRFSLERATDGVEYRLTGRMDCPVEILRLAIRQTPDYVTVTTYNSHRDPVREVYYGLDGAPYWQPGGYAALERSFDAADRVYSIRHYDDRHNPVLIDGGFHEVRYGYNGQGSVNREAYFDTRGRPVVGSGGYALAQMEYDRYGNMTGIRYYGADGEMILNAAGYAELRRTYDEHQRLVEEEYLDTEGEILPSFGD